jgi:hypothetical protein
VTMLQSHAANGTARVTWSLRDVDAESCWRRHCQGNFAAAQFRCRVMLAIMLPSNAGDGTTTQGCTGCSKVVQPPRLVEVLSHHKEVGYSCWLVAE